MFRRILRVALVVIVLVPILTLAGASAPARAGASGPATTPDWSWPVASPRVVRPYVQPPHPYGAGHRGIDIRGAGGRVSAPDDGIVAFAGVVVDRAVLTIDHGGGLVSSFEPVTTTLRPGVGVARGEEIGTIAPGGHTAPRVLHLGARIDGEYVNPLLLLGGIPRAVLLPCC